jgi:hypothetical protein
MCSRSIFNSRAVWEALLAKPPSIEPVDVLAAKLSK